MSRKKNWISRRQLEALDNSIKAGMQDVLEQMLNAEMQRLVEEQRHRGGNMHGMRLTVHTPEKDYVVDFPEKEQDP